MSKTIKTIITLIVLISFILLLNIGTISAQNMRKVFKYIETEKAEKAQNELNKVSDVVKNSNEGFILYSFAKCLLLCNENTTDYDPFKALETYEVTTKAEFNQSEINKFLNNYELSIEIIKETICSSILNQAKKINTEASYYKAILAYNKARSFGIDCGYKAEVDTLWVNAAYNAAKTTNSYEAYVKFFTNHGNSRYKQEVIKKFEEFEFQRAKRINTLDALNHYISSRSDNDNPNLHEAIHLRDSIAFSTLSKTYSDYQKFAEEYPNSEYIEEIKHALPELLYSQAFVEKNIELMNLFINEHPNDIRISKLKGEVERLEYLDLLQNISLIEFEDFKRRYPNSLYITEISERYSSVIENSDIKKEGLQGAIKSIVTIRYLSDENNRIDLEVKTEFNEFGKITYCEPYDFYYKDFNQFINEYVPSNNLEENSIKFIGGGYAPNIDYNFSYWGIGAFTYEYGKNGLLTRATDGNTICKFFYGESGELIKREITNPRFSKHHIIKYGREIDHSFKNVYYPNGSLYRQFMYFDYGGRESITEKNNRGNIESQVTIERDFRYLIVKRIIESSLDINNVYCSNKEITYKYDENERLSSIHITAKWKDYPYQNYNLPKQWKVTQDGTIDIKRDTHGQITSCSINDEIEYEYKYDSLGNWIECIVFSVKRNDIEIKQQKYLYKRTITYY